MKKTIKAFVALFILLALSYNEAVAHAAQEPFTSAQSAILMEQSTGRVLYAKDPDTRRPMASTTKIMTALVVLENAGLEETVTIDERMSGIEGSSMFLEVGEVLRVEDLLLGLMLRSGNDASVALAIHVGGSVEGFVEMMNQRALEMGLESTHFANPNGLPNKQHYTTARELAQIAAKAMENEVFRAIVSTARATVKWDGHPWNRVLTNKNRILTLIEGGNGIKTGFTKEAGRCLVSSALQEGMQLIAVTLNCSDDFNQSARLLQSGFDNYDMQVLYHAGTSVGAVETDDGPVDVITLRDIGAPVKEGERVEVTFSLPKRLEGQQALLRMVGQAQVSVDGKEICCIPLYLSRQIDTDWFWRAIKTILSKW